MVDNKPYQKEEWLRVKYIEEGLTTYEMGDICNVAPTTISRWMDKYGIDRRDLSDYIEPFEKRFWDNVSKGANDECWEWTGAVGDPGYGQISKDGGLIRTHRASYKIHKGEIGDKYVLHDCDNKLCVNPNHLHLGTAADNIREAVERDRTARNEEHGQAKLSEDEVKEIRRRYKYSNSTHKELANEYGVSRRHVGKIIQHTRRKYVKNTNH